MADFTRARSSEHKAERMQSILDTTEELYRTVPYHEITLGLIAHRLGWSRSNMYKYVSSVEEIFLVLHNRANQAYFEELLEYLDGTETIAAFARIWATVTGAHPEFLRYQEILTAIIESNVSFEKLIWFKSAFSEMLEPVTALLSTAADCSASDAAELYLRLMYQAPALYAQFHFSERTLRAMEQAGLRVSRGSFEDAYASFVRMCLENARTGPHPHDTGRT